MSATFTSLVGQLAAHATAARPLAAARLLPVTVACSSLVVRIISLRMRREAT